jgi:type I restriction enzyme S subunit
MIADLKPYPAYKDSGVSWLGEVPEHWQTLPALAVYKPKLIRNIGMFENTVLSLSYGRIIVKPPEKLRGLVPESFETYQIVDPGNIIVRTTDLQNDKTSLRIGHSKNRGIITSAYMCLETTDRVSNEFGYQFLNTYDLLKIIYGFGSGLRQNLDFGHIKRMPVLVPPSSEQAAIVRFLGHADRRIRRYIRAKQRLIALLNEQKQAIIHQAVTKGLDPNVRMKPSGVAWLGEVPEHWKVRRFKLVAGVDSSLIDPRLSHHREKILIAPNHIERGGTARLLKSETADAQGADSGKYEVRAGQIVYTKIRPYLRKAVIAPTDCLCSADMYPISIRHPDQITPEFLLLVILSVPFTQYTIDCSLRAAMPKVNREALGEAPMWFPDIFEQHRIMEYIIHSTSSLQGGVLNAYREIELLREYRTRLIADVVTGKLDVREAAANLPDEIDEPDDLAEADSLDEVGEMLDDLDNVEEAISAD